MTASSASSATFDLLRKRLAAAAETLRAKSDALNAKRISTFGRVEPKLLARLSAAPSTTASRATSCAWASCCCSATR